MNFSSNSTDEVRFRCTGCGRCCGTPPAIMIDEILEQAENFVLGAQLRIISRVDPEDPRDIKIMINTYPELDLGEQGARQAMAAHMNKIADIQGVAIDDPITDGSGPCLAVSLIDVDQLAGSCPKLGSDGRCGIYETRPRKCRSVPIDEMVPEGLLSGSLDHEISKMISAGGTCEHRGDAPVIWKDGLLMNEGDQFVHGANGANMSDAAGLLSKEVIKEYLEFKSIENRQPENVVANVVEHLGVEGIRPVFALVPAVARLMKVGALTQERAAHLLLTQARLIEERLPGIDPRAPIEGVLDAEMKIVLSDWRNMYITVGQSWLGWAAGTDR